MDRAAWLAHACFAAFGLALFDALSAGTDFVGIKGTIVAAVALGPVLWLGFVRILEPRRPASRRPLAPAPRSG